ncbi:Repressor ROX1 [Psilocybe cubensis]|uniref:HMG box domain-containing protein n=2 Tax=Psilocybe cubensis TaxID=181762 RepID=A0A8H7XN61_PSICU|nr:Repressor ROX1 [Psilocybe cubensis]KAH9482015.1 Repressor ROX1 [Psilocybe cubensis]
MPAERTKGLKRSASAGNTYVWTSQPEPTNGSEVSFTSAMTSWSFSDTPPPLVDAPSEFVMFPPEGDAAAPRRQPHSKKKPENHIPRPPNAFILFRSSFIKSQHVSTAVETNHSTLSKIIGLTWQSLPEDQRQIWHQKAKEALDEHKRKFPKYAFRPVQTKAKGGPVEKRKVREVEPKDIKRCTKIAQLLVEGKKGSELNAAVEEFDKYHVPEIVTRFEAPITAHAFRRSSSAPVPDTDNSRPQSFLQHVASSPRKPRSSSTRPTRCSTPDNSTTPNLSPANGNVAAVPEPLIEGPLKEEPAFNFGTFSFDNIVSPLPTYDCDPLSASLNNGSFHASLTIDTSFMQQWDASPSPGTPSTPDYMSNSSPLLSSPPTPSYSSTYDAFDHQLSNAFDDFSVNYPTFDQSCGVPQQNICGSGIDSLSFSSPQAHANYAAYGDHAHQEISAPLAHLDLDFSAFMTSIPQYAM